MIKDIMSRNLIVCDTDDNVLYVSNLMKKYDVGFVLVMCNNKLFGVITDRDLICDLADELAYIKSFATKKIITIDENKAIAEALELMRNHKLKRLVVTNGNKITGVLSLSDIYPTDISSDEIVKTLKCIYAINRNNGEFQANINEFIL